MPLVLGSAALLAGASVLVRRELTRRRHRSRNIAYNDNLGSLFASRRRGGSVEEKRAMCQEGAGL